MKKLLLLFAAILMASTGMWAETVDYLYPVYNTDGVPTSGIKEWKTASVDATVVENASEQVTWNAGWYVVTGTDVTLSQGAICSGNVRLILADGAKLTATGIDDVLNSTPGIQVSGDGNSLTVYVQTAQTGRLIATGKTYSAGIGGNGADGLRDGSNITINGGTVTANGGSQAAAIGGGLRGNGSNITINGGTVTAKGSAAGIGGGNRGNGTNITINGGTVTARGGDGSDGIGNGENPTTPSSNIFVATWCILKAGSSLTPTDVIENTGSDLATSLEGKRNVTVETPKFAVTYGDNITVSPAFTSGAEIEAGTQITFTAADRTADSYGLWGFYEESTFDTPITTGVNNQTYTVMVTDAAISVYARYEKYASASYVYPVYNDPDDVTKGVKEDWGTETVNAYVVTSSDTPVIWGEDGKETWYVVTGEDVKLSQGAICAGKVNLILADGAKLTATGNIVISTSSNTPGIQVSGEGNSLAIYGQTAQSGQLVANASRESAGIGGEENGSASNITINGGVVTSEGGSSAAGIGGGEKGSGSNITINGGTVTASGGDGAGIGGGSQGNGSNITINGGTVTAHAVLYGAGIGGGWEASGSNITINGGTVTVNGGRMAAGIGGGYNGSGSNIIINGGRVTATGGEYNGKNGVEYGDGIGSGFDGSASSYIFVAKNLLVKAGNTEETMYVIGNYTDLDLASGFAGKRFATIEPEPAPEEKEVTYIDENGEEQKVKANVVLSRSFPVTWGEANKTTWYAVTHADVQLISPVCQGDVRLILADGAKLTANGLDDKAGIQISGDDNSLTIYGQAAQSGQLIATGGKLHAGIGGEEDGSASNITINGGTVTATGTFGAGIGGGFGGSGSHITINGGIVTATSTYGAGIGGGVKANGSNITINGGTVTAHGVLYGAGIGGGYLGSGSDITINGGTVTANGGSDAAGIGSGFNGSASSYIFVATILTLKADGNNPPTTVITNNGGDLTESLAGKQYVTIEPNSVSYVYPVYNDPDDVTKGVKEWKTGTVNAIEITSSDTPVTLGEAGKTTWYVVTGEDVTLSQGAICYGNVNLILADGAKLTANGVEKQAGINVSEFDSNYGYTHLAIYGQAAQSGELEANGGTYGAGIGGGYEGFGMFITINGGTVTATGGKQAAGIGGGRKGFGSNITINGGTVTANAGAHGAGIGGGLLSPGLFITVNGGTVTANGGMDAAGIGSGFNGSASSNITVATILTLKAGSTENPADAIANNGGDLAGSLAGQRYVTIEPNSATSFKVQATSADESKGSVTGGGIYEAGTEVTLTATPAENYVFEKWSDGTTANPYVFTATKDVTLTAFFTEATRHITDGTEYTAAESKFLPEVIYTRTFDNTNWQALYVPFSIDYEEWSEKFDIAKIRNFIEYDDDDNGTVDRTYLVAIKKASGSTEPNYPYLIRAKEAGTYSLVLKDKTLEAAKITTIDCRSVENEYTFTGTYTKITDMYANGYYALAGGVLCKANSAGVTLKPQRWYMEVTSRTGSSSTKAQSIQILVDGEEGIEGICEFGNSEISKFGNVGYDLTGRMLSPFKGERGEGPRGINIVNGKKIIK